MSIVRYEPFQDLARWGSSRDYTESERQINRLFNRAFSRFFGEEGQASGLWAPAVDIYENEQNLVLKAELPGVDPKDVEVRVENGILYLKGERKTESDAKQENYHWVERSYGSFQRTFTLPSSVDAEKVSADYKDGVLTLTLPKREEAKPKAIKINVSKN